MNVRDWKILGATVAITAGCGGSNGTGTSAPRTGTTADGGGAADGGGRMGGGGGGGDACGHVVDLATAATRAGSGWTWHGTTVGAPNILHPGCAAMDAGEVVLRWTPPDGVSAVRVTTDSPGTHANTVLYVRDACNGAAGPMGMPAGDLACNDDDYTEAPHSTVYLQGLTAGQAIYLVVDGTHTDPPAGMTGGDWNNASGDVVLTIEPVTLGAAGSPCRPAPDAAADGGTGTGAGRCDGTSLCTDGVGGAADGTALCVAGVAVGASCDPRAFQNTCMDGATCAMDPVTGDPTMARCMAAGSGAGARCRASAPRCDGPLVCGTGDAPVCVHTVARGMECDPTGAVNACAAGSTCHADDAGMATCQ